MSSDHLEEVFEVAKELAATDISYQDVPRVAAEIVSSLRKNGSYDVKTIDDFKTLPGHENPDVLGKTVDYMGRLAQFWDGDIAGIPNKPSALASLLVMAPLGAALGIGGGRAVSALTGGHVDPGDLRSALMGAALGSLPGIFYMGANAAGGQDILHGDVLNAPLAKKSNYIPIDQFNVMLFDDPAVATRLPPTIQAAAAGMIQTASNLPGRKSELPIVTPTDIARLAVGMGSGYASGLFAGKALGALFGVSDKAQQVLRQSGAAAGLIKAVVPMVYGQN